MLEDDFTDVLRKAMVGRGVTFEQLVEKSGVPAEVLHQFSKGDFSEGVARAVAVVLGLKVDAYASLPEYHPSAPELPELKRLILPFGPYDVNAWWLEIGGVTVLFDAGYKAGDLMLALPSMPDHVFITHGHHDHMAAVNDLRAKRVSVVMPDKIQAGDSFDCGAVRLKACDLSGHCTPQYGFLIEGLSLPVLVVGDALFSGSMGKCASPELYQHALERLHTVFGELPDDAVLLPGHGPMTTLGQERVSNPFL